MQAASADGVSLYVRPEPGNAAEVSLIDQSLERLRELVGPGGLLIVDSACGHPKTLCQIARAQLRFIAPLRVQSGFRERFLGGRHTFCVSAVVKVTVTLSCVNE